MLRGVLVIEAARRLQRVPEGLLGLKKVLIDPGLVGIVQRGAGQAGAEQGEGFEGELRGFEEPLCELRVVERGFEDEAARGWFFLRKGDLFTLGELSEELVGAVGGGFLMWVGGNCVNLGELDGL